MVAGDLQSFVEATSRRLGNTYLRCVHSLVHYPESGTALTPYLSMVSLPATVHINLLWLGSFLLLDGSQNLMVKPIKLKKNIIIYSSMLKATPLRGRTSLPNVAPPPKPMRKLTRTHPHSTMCTSILHHESPSSNQTNIA